MVRHAEKKFLYGISKEQRERIQKALDKNPPFYFGKVTSRIKKYVAVEEGIPLREALPYFDRLESPYNWIIKTAIINELFEEGVL
jgi:hypothetical protein